MEFLLKSVIIPTLVFQLQGSEGLTGKACDRRKTNDMSVGSAYSQATHSDGILQEAVALIAKGRHRYPWR